MPALRLDPDYDAVVQAMDAAGQPLPGMDDPSFSTVLESACATTTPADDGGIIETKFSIPSIDGAMIDIYRGVAASTIAADGTDDEHENKDSTNPNTSALRPALVWVHGGGYTRNKIEPPFFASRRASQADASAAAAAGVVLFAVDYRLAPAHPFPAALGDVVAALAWVKAQAAELGVDPHRIGLVGSSAGGGLAAASALLLRDLEERAKAKATSQETTQTQSLPGWKVDGVPVDVDALRLPRLARLVLFCPMLDSRTNGARFPPGHPLLPFLTWTVGMNEHGWHSYLGGGGGDGGGGDGGGKEGGADQVPRETAAQSPYAVPARATSLRDLPRTYIDVGGVDLFRDEAVDFAARMLRADVEVEMHVWPGLPHSFEDVEGDVPVVQLALERRTSALKDF